jgi:hypothetical protein
MAQIGNCLLAKNYVADGAVEPFRIVKAGSNDGGVAQATASTQPLFGVSGTLGAADGERIDIHRIGLVPARFGGTVARGDKVTADSEGKAVAAAPAAGVNAHVIGIAEQSAVAGDIGMILIAPSVMQG